MTVVETKTLLSPAVVATKQRRSKHSHTSDDLSNHRDDSSSSTSRSRSSTGGGTDDEDQYYAHNGEDHNSMDFAPPFLPLEEQNHTKVRRATPSPLDKVYRYMPTLKQFVSLTMFSLIALVIWDALFTAPENRLLQPESSLRLLKWVQGHPIQGLFWITLMIAACVVIMIPLGTPLTLGCGYVYKGAYGWKLGLFVATLVSMGGSCLGAVVCFLLGRYLMRDAVKKWIRKYPLFDAIDVAAAEHGLRIMAMLYLTPLLPLGPVSYMCGTTAMPLSSFVLAKIAALPLMLLYVFIGASMGALIGGDASKAAAEVKQIEENEYLIASGILLSFVMIACITRQVRKELNKILERQQKLKPGETEQQLTLNKDDAHSADDSVLEMGITKRRRA